VALIGNPNTGKSTLFNALSGLHVRTGNYPGVTVDQRTGRVTWRGAAVELIDLPGTYSLAPRSPDELVAVEVLTGYSGAPAPIWSSASAMPRRSIGTSTWQLRFRSPVCRSCFA
jgi:ferrous iron transport protein B